MFSPEASIVGARSSLRNPRRRPRNSDGAQQLQQSRRKRSKLGDETFTPIDDAQTNGNGSALMNGHAGNGSTVDNSVVTVDMPVREKKQPVKRAPKDEASLVLDRHETFIVKKLPSFPNALSGGSVPYRASASASAGLALALTSTQALVWDYSSAGGPTKILALPLPPSIQGAEPLPLGAIVRNGPSNEFGVVAIAPSTGKIVFWENADSAEARSHFPQRHQGLEGSIRVYSGEHITDLVDIEHAGYVLVFSSGRLAQLTLRDSQGRPSIHAAVLSAPTSSGGSFFGLKNLLGSAIRKTIASVKARPSESKGQMEVITATRSGLFHLWDLTWSGQHTFKREIDVRANVLTAMQQGTAPETRGQQDVHLLDFALTEPQSTSTNVDLLILVALSGRNMMDYFLLEIDLSEDGGIVRRAIPLRTFQAELPKEPIGTLLLPSPGHTALVQFPSAIVVASLAEPEETPEAQLFADSGDSILPFQDCVYFRDDANVCIVGHALEQNSRKDKTANALLFVQDFGILRVSATGFEPDDRKKRSVSASSKMISATLFGNVPGTILDFSIKSRFSFDQKEIEDCAIAVSKHILSSSFPQLEMATASMDDHLRKRASALRNLITFLRSENLPLGFAAKWRLLWHAEKLAAAQGLWKWYQDKLQDQQLRPGAYPEKVSMGDVIYTLSENLKTPLNPEKGETDPIRKYMLKDLDTLGQLIPCGWYHLRLIYLSRQSPRIESVTQRLSEAGDVFIATLEAALSFRQANAERYGLDPDTLEDGIMEAEGGYDLLPQPWTSTHNLVTSIRGVTDMGRVHAVEGFEEGGDTEYYKKLAEDNPRLVKLCSQLHIERFLWALHQSDEKTREMGRNLREEWDQKVRPSHIHGLMEIGLPTEGMALAEQYEDMETLANLVWDETEWLQLHRLESQSKMEQAQSKVKLDRIKERTANYFTRYGKQWAEAYFNKHIVENKSGQLLENAALYQEWLTGFLQTDPKYARLCWINDVIAENDFEMAAINLWTVAKEQESNSWCSKVELSMAKLALLCRDGDKPSLSELGNEPLAEPVAALNESKKKFGTIIYSRSEARLEYAKIQETVYEQRMLPIITSALDENVALETLMDSFGREGLAERPALQSLLRQAFDDLMHHRVIEPPLMIDALTLMSNPADEPATLVDGNEFGFALQTLALNWSELQRTTRIGLRGLIWKRLIIQDDWARVNETKDLSDAELNAFLLETHTGSTLKTVVKMAHEDAVYRDIMLPPVDEISGSGCTDGELCIRFPSEDLRKPIMRDNALDEAILQTHVEKHRLEAWLKATLQAAVQANRREMEAAQVEAAEADARETEEAEVAGSAVAESVEGVGEAAEENFEGDDEESVAERDGDVEMTYS